MRDKDLYAAIIGVTSPWMVHEVGLRTEAEEVEVFIEHDGRHFACPQCAQASPGYDTRRRS